MELLLVRFLSVIKVLRLEALRPQNEKIQSSKLLAYCMSFFINSKNAK